MSAEKSTSRLIETEKSQDHLEAQMTLDKDDDFQKVDGSKKSFMKNWILLSLISVILFSAANLSIASLGPLGMGALYFFNSGGFFVCVMFFIIHYSKFDYQNKDFYDKTGFRRNVWTNEDGSIAWYLLLQYCIGAFFQASVFMSINATFIYANKADLNVGIPSAIWAINPFFTALLEYIFKKVPIKPYHMVGMSIMTVSAVVISISDVVIPSDKKSAANIDGAINQSDDADLVPIYVPILIAFIMPLVCAFFALQVNYVIGTLKVSPDNWNFAYNLIYSGICLIAGIIKFSVDPSYFLWSLFIAGCLGSFFNTSGSLFCGAALGSGQPLGPILALIGTQTIVVTLAAATISKEMPNPLQWAGLFIGLLSACILTMPDQMYDLWYRVTRCSDRPQTQKDTKIQENIQ